MQRGPAGSPAACVQMYPRVEYANVCAQRRSGKQHHGEWTESRSGHVRVVKICAKRVCMVAAGVERAEDPFRSLPQGLRVS